MILDPNLTGQLPEVIAEGSYSGMQTFDQHLLQHLQAGRITMESAMRIATSPHDFKLMVAAAAKPAGDGPEATVNGAAPAPPPEPVAAEPPMTVGLADRQAAAPSAPPPGIRQ
jgi:twitching motility protein PilT